MYYVCLWIDCLSDTCPWSPYSNQQRASSHSQVGQEELMALGRLRLTQSPSLSKEASWEMAKG